MSDSIFHPETFKTGETPDEIYGLRNIRLLGPFWSVIAQTGDTETVDGHTAWPVRPLSVDAEPSGDDKLHAPRLLRASLSELRHFGELIGSYGDGIAVAHTNPSFGAPPPEGEDTRRKTPLIDQMGEPATETVIGTPTVDWPAMQYPATTEEDRQVNIAPMQLVRGALRFAPNAEWMASLYKALKVTAPKADTYQHIVLLPEGVAFPARIELPWLRQVETGDDHLFHVWMLLTWRQESKTKQTPVLRLWTDATLADWSEDARKLLRDSVTDVLKGLSAASRGAMPRWFDLRASSDIDLGAVFWPLVYDEMDRPKVKAREDDGLKPISIERAALVARLTDRSIDTPGETARTAMTLLVDSYRIARAVFFGNNDLTLSADAGTETGGTSVDYRYELDKSDERLSVEDGALTVPLLSTADAMRRALDLQPPQDGALADPLVRDDELWLHSPVEGGWLHWPMPNATAARLAKAKPEGDQPQTDDDPEMAKESTRAGIEGAVTFGNAAPEGTPPEERPWNFTILGAGRSELNARFSPLAKTWKIEEVSLSLNDASISFFGLLPVTPYRQTPERLLPDHTERALNSTSVLAVDPSTLLGVEEVPPADRPSVNFDSLKFEIVQRAAQTPAVAGLSYDLNIRLDHPGVPIPVGASRDVWYWSRHRTTPAIQTMPLAVAGRDRNAPTGLRELAPVVLSFNPEDGPIRFSVSSGETDPAISGMALPLGVNWPTGPFIRSALVHPDFKDITTPVPVEEIGMASLGVAGLMLMPAAGSRSQAVLRGDDAWIETGDWNHDTKTHLKLRHDLPWRDEAYAYASTPPTDEEDDETLASTSKPPTVNPLFRQTPNNSPEAAVAEVWRDAMRRGALAALDGREVLAREESGQLRLTGLNDLADLEKPSELYVGKVDFSAKITTEAPGPAPEPEAEKTILTALASVTLAGLGQFGNGGRFDGLPASAALTGLSGSLSYDGNSEIVEPIKRKMDFVHGTQDLARQADPNAFTDQRALTQHVAKSDAGSRWITRKVVDPLADPKDRETTLLGVTHPLEVMFGDATAMRLWFMDVPLDRLSGGREIGDRVNAASRERNHLDGYRWVLEATDPEGVPVSSSIDLDGLDFDAAQLLSVKDGGKSVQILGRLRLPLGKKRELPDGAAGTAVLYLDFRSDHYEVTSIKASEVLWPLADPVANEAPPMLAIGTLGYDVETGWRHGDTSEVRLHYTLAGVPCTMPLTPRESSGAGDNSMIIDHVALRTPAPEEGSAALLLRDLTVTLTAATKTAAPATPTAGMQYRASFGVKGADVAFDFKVDLLTRVLDGGTGGFGRLGDFAVPIRPLGTAKPPLPADPIISNKAQSFMIAPGVLAFLWEHAEGKASAFVPGLPVMQASGSLFAVLDTETSTSAPRPAYPAFRITGHRIEASVEMAAETGPVLPGAPETDATGLSLAIDYDMQDAAPTYRLHGTFAVTNLLAWPDLGEMAASKIAIEGNPTTHIVHDAMLRFDGQRLRASDLAALREENAGKPVVLTAAVTHRLQRLKRGRVEGEPYTWHLPQTVQLFGPDNLREALNRWLGAESGVFATSGENVPELKSGLTNWKLADHGPMSGQTALELSDRLFGGGVEREILAIDFSSLPMLTLPKDPLLRLMPLMGLAIATAGEADALYTEHPVLASELDRLGRLLVSSPKDPASLELPPFEHPDAFTFREPPRQLIEDRRAQVRALSRSGFVDHLEERLSPQGRVASQSGGVVDAKWAFALLPGAPLAALIGDTLARLGKEGGAVQAFGLADTDLLEPKKERSYREVLLKLAERLDRSFLLTPELGAAVDSGPAPDAVSVRLISARDPGTSPSDIASIRLAEAPTLQNLRNWGALTQRRLLPSARLAILAVSGNGGVTREIVSVGYSLDTLDQIAVPNSPADEFQRMAVAPRGDPASNGALLQRVARGYTPRTSAAAFFRVETEEPTEETLLNASALSTEVALDGAGTIAAEGPMRVWLTERVTPSFRPYSPALNAIASKMTTAMPHHWRAEIPVGFAPHDGPRFPAPQPEPEEAMAVPVAVEAQDQDQDCDGRYRRGYAPDAWRVSALAHRSGAWTWSRRSIVVETACEAQIPPAPFAISSAAPLHQRFPRPLRLGLNDQPRASEFDSVPNSVGSRPHSILYGPALSLDPVNDPPQGTDRSPRADYAEAITLVSPPAGVLPANWNRRFEIEWRKIGGDETTDNASPFNPVKATLAVAGRKVTALYESEAERTGGTRDIFEMPLEALGILADSPAGREVTLSLEYSYRGRFERTLVFSLLTSGDRPVPVAERPVYVRFEDPEYDDLLTGVANLDQKVWPAPATERSPETLVLAADVKEIEPVGVFDVALALRPLDPDAPRETADEEDLPVATLLFERRRPNVSEVVELELPEKAKLQFSQAGSADRIDLATLRRVDGVPEAEILRPDDQLAIDLCISKNWLGEEKPSITLDIVKRAQLPPNEASYSVLALSPATASPKPSKARVAVPLTAPSPTASTIELIDPREMAEGLVRRRASFLWRYFLPGVVEQRVSVQKISATGTSTIEKDLSKGWKSTARDIEL